MEKRTTNYYKELEIRINVGRYPSKQAMFDKITASFNRGMITKEEELQLKELLDKKENGVLSL